MDSIKKENPLKILSFQETKLGIKAVVALTSDSNGKQIFKDEVKLWKDDSRKGCARKCVEALNGNIPPKDAEKAREQINQWLIGEENKIKDQNKKEKSGANPASDNDKPKKISAEEREEALAFLKDPNLLGRVQDDLTKMGIVDEENNKVLLYLIGTSRKMSKGLAATIKGSSSVGKNHLVNTVSSFIPREDVKEFTRVSSKALSYIGETALQNKLVICTEVVGKQEAEYLIRAFISEGEITSLTTVRDFEGGPFRTQESKVKGPFAYLDTTTNYNIHPENATRIFEIYMNESEEQTRDINRQQALEAGPEGFRIKQERERIKRVHQNAQRLFNGQTGGSRLVSSWQHRGGCQIFS